MKIMPKTTTVLTIWTDHSYKIWNAMDALYAQADDDYLITLPLPENFNEQNTTVTFGG